MQADAAVAGDAGQQAAVSGAAGRTRSRDERSGLRDQTSSNWSVLSCHTLRLQPRSTVPQHAQSTAQLTRRRPHRCRLTRFIRDQYFHDRHGGNSLDPPQRSPLQCILFCVNIHNHTIFIIKN